MSRQAVVVLFVEDDGLFFSSAVGLLPASPIRHGAALLFDVTAESANVRRVQSLNQRLKRILSVLIVKIDVARLLALERSREMHLHRFNEFLAGALFRVDLLYGE